jgi:hypothetical protein
VLRGRDADGRVLIPDESVDLVYLDPPFNSAATYNVLFRAPDGLRSAVPVVPAEAAPLAAIAARVKAVMDPEGILNPGRIRL